MEEKYLPIGTVVKLKGATKPLMIIGFCAQNSGTGDLFDYSGCLYPEGLLSHEQIAAFNHDQISEILFEGFSNDEEKAFKEQMQQYIHDQSN